MRSFCSGTQFNNIRHSDFHFINPCQETSPLGEFASNNGPVGSVVNRGIVKVRETTDLI